MSGSVIVRENGLGRYQQEVLAGEHRLIADEPASLGGNDGGPGPFELLMAALGACTSMTLRMYAERKQLALTRVAVELSHEKITQEGKSHDRISRRIHLEGDLSAETRQRLLEIAGKCPVHRSLSQAMSLPVEAAE
jgi:putative redox protein